MVTAATADGLRGRPVLWMPAACVVDDKIFEGPIATSGKFDCGDHRPVPDAFVGAWQLCVSGGAIVDALTLWGGC